MDKRLSRSDYLFMLVFIFMLLASVGAFFYGLKIGKQKMEAKYEHLLETTKKASEPVQAYDQQYLVSFYHTIYVPYRDFQKKWFTHMNTIEAQNDTIDPQDLIKELGKLAKEKYDAMLTSTMPIHSPLLQQAHTNYLKSLKLFSEAASRFHPKEGAADSRLIDQLNEDAYIQEAKSFALKAQNDYYASIVKWNASTNPAIKGESLLSHKQLTAQQWSALNLNLKNAYIAKTMAAYNYYEPYFPQDLTSRVDGLLYSGQARKLKIDSVDRIISTLVQTGAVRSGDYIDNKSKFYADETVPQLPFFFD